MEEATSDYVRMKETILKAYRMSSSFLSQPRLTESKRVEGMVGRRHRAFFAHLLFSRSFSNDSSIVVKGNHV
jgi:hypothetical protein